MSAALWSSDVGLRSLLIEREPILGGQLSQIFNPINNYLGVIAANGEDLREAFLRSLGTAKFDLLLGRNVVKADLERRSVELDDGSSVFGEAIIIATGVRRRKLGVPGEEEFFGRGILTSGAKEVETAKGKSVVIVGGGDAAFENALILAPVARTVTLIHRQKEYKARNEFVEAVRKKENVCILPNKYVTRFVGNDLLRGVSIADVESYETDEIAADLALVRIGVRPNSEIFTDQLNMDGSGYVAIAADCMTSLEYVYAVGDIANPNSLSVATAVGNSATAVLHISQLIESNFKNPKI